MRSRAVEVILVSPPGGFQENPLEVLVEALRSQGDGFVINGMELTPRSPLGRKGFKGWVMRYSGTLSREGDEPDPRLNLTDRRVREGS